MSGLRRWWAGQSPATGAAVMATAIVSTGLHLVGAEALSLAALALAGAVWVLLGIGFGRRLVLDRGRWAAEARSPAALTAAAATAVLAARLAILGGHLLAEALLALAAVLWAVLLPIVVRHWDSRMPGAVFLCCVATQGLVVTAAGLAGAEHTAWLAHTALVLFWLGLALYALALPRFDGRQVLEGPGDHWIAGGALAISALAGAGLLTAGDTSGLYLWNDDDRDTLRTTTVLLLALSLAAYVVLLVAEAARPRLRYDQRRWATVFPLGMTAAATLSVMTAVGIPWLRGPGHVLVWVAVAGWLWVAAGTVADAVRTARAGSGEVRSRAPR
ncbi:tellurite resistance/C4-dicarboxylate transporter family protein [Streptomyces sp. AM6-12]|uniref:tellurite resistance/C4-dicarboxylate transporter family protein n=1 Tax=Streptomyces sp. AM6-12 TaxID=3345149 RepID=UPI0037BA74AA